MRTVATINACKDLFRAPDGACTLVQLFFYKQGAPLEQVLSAPEEHPVRVPGML